MDLQEHAEHKTRIHQGQPDNGHAGRWQLRLALPTLACLEKHHSGYMVPSHSGKGDMFAELRHVFGLTPTGPVNACQTVVTST